MRKMFENDCFIIYEDCKGYDFSYIIENKKEKGITICYGEDLQEELKIKDWIGLFDNQKHIVEQILDKSIVLFF